MKSNDRDGLRDRGIFGMKHCRGITRIPCKAQINLDPFIEFFNLILAILTFPLILPVAFFAVKQFSDCVVDGEGNDICG